MERNIDLTNFVPKISVTKSSELDSGSILFLKLLFQGHRIDCRNLQEGGTMTSIDGRLDFTCEDGTANECVTVQVKHLTIPPKNGKAFYDIPRYIYAYAYRRIGEVVLFIACDQDNGVFYWRYIDKMAIKDFLYGANYLRKTARYYFKKEETCTKDNIIQTLETWKKMYLERMAAFNDNNQQAESFSSTQRIPFNQISSVFHGLANSHIKRKESEQILNWINSDLSKDSNNLCLVIGNAGVGKSVVIKDLIEDLSISDIKCLSIKADSIDDINNPISLEKIHNALACYASKQKRVVLIIDQIDALSQGFSTERKRLDVLTEVISSINDWDNVRAVVSCRKYDLEYDTVLSSLKNQSKIIEIGLLSDTDVTLVLERLHPGLTNKVNKVTFNLLKNAQYLNSFCYLYQREKNRLDFHSPIELYDALWDSTLDNLPSTTTKEDVETVLFSIADCIRITGLLSPNWEPTTVRMRDAFKYLASCGIICINRKSVSLFHQTFYDYVLAKAYLTKKKSFIIELENEFQGLEIRSTVKAIIDYYRGHNDSEYVAEIQQLFSSNKIRHHIKLLAVSILASLDDPRPFEKKIIREVCQKDEKLLIHYLRGIESESWYNTACSFIKYNLPDSKQESILFIPMLRVLSHYAFKHPDETFSMLELIKDECAKSYAIMYVLMGHNDYQNDSVIRAFNAIRDYGKPFFVNRVQDALRSNEEFGLNETKKLIHDYLESDYYSTQHDGHEIVNVLCSNLLQECPQKFLLLLHSCISQYIRDHSSYDYNEFSKTKLSNKFSLNEYQEKLLEMYEQLLIRFSGDKTVIAPIVDELLSLNNDLALSMAFLIIAEHPESFNKIVDSHIYSSSIIEKYLDSSFEFYYLRMLKSWYMILDEKQAQEYQRIILSFTSSCDFWADKERKYGCGLFPLLWYKKWILICNTLPKKGLLPEMKKCAGELLRRFGKEIIIKREQKDISCMAHSSGLTDDATYAKFSVSNWLYSFERIDERKFWARHEYPFDPRFHADVFKRCVASNPNKFLTTLLDIAKKENVNPIYSLSGIEGLLEGGVSLDTVWPFVQKFISSKYASENPSTFKQLANHYLKADNRYIDKIIPVLVELLNMPFKERAIIQDERKDEMNLERSTSDLLNLALNSVQGRAMELLIQLTAIQERKEQAYGIIINSIPFVHPSLYSLPVHYLTIDEPYEDSSYFSLLKVCLNHMGPEALLLRPRAIQWCYYHKPDVVSEYFTKMESEPKSHIILSQIYYVGLCHDELREKCWKGLERILSLKDEYTIATIIKISMKTFAEESFKEWPRYFLKQFSTDERDVIIDAYCLHCDDLPIEAFPFFKEIAGPWKRKKHRDIHSQLQYITKCIDRYPTECYKFMQEQEYASIDNQWITDEDAVKVLLKIYGKFKDDDNEDALNEIMDMFDEYIFRGNRVLDTALSMLN